MNLKSGIQHLILLCNLLLREIFYTDNFTLYFIAPRVFIQTIIKFHTNFPLDAKPHDHWILNTGVKSTEKLSVAPISMVVNFLTALFNVVLDLINQDAESGISCEIENAGHTDRTYHANTKQKNTQNNVSNKVHQDMQYIS